MLGTMADAEDVVQDVWLRWQATDRQGIERPEAWLTTVTTRVAIDRLRSIGRQQAREAYIGPWLPEPILFERDPSEAAEFADTLTLGFLVMMDRLSPTERAVLLLADVFAVPYRDVATAVGRSEVACRQIASRARRRLHTTETRRPKADERELIEHLLAALIADDASEVLAYLAPDVVLLSDGGALRKAARYPVVGAKRVGRFLYNLARRHVDDMTVEHVRVNGDPGLVLRVAGAIDQVIAFEHDGERIHAIWMISNPDKLGHLHLSASIV